MKRARPLFLGLILLGACAHAAPPCPRGLGLDHRGGEVECGLPGFDDRAYLVHLPPRPSAEAPLPVVIAIHGGGGNKESMQRLSCPGGVVGDPGCLDAAADRAGFAVVYPDGTSSALIRKIRTWNAGGGVGELRCVSGRACETGVDDVRYFSALLEELERVLPVDPARIYAIGMSNGAAMAHRLACALAPKISGIVAVGGANQVAFAQGCTPARPVPILQIHGEEDPCWEFEGGNGACLAGDDKRHVAVLDSMRRGAALNHCAGGPVEEALPDLAPEDGTRVFRARWTGCEAPVELLRIAGGGHTWPRGWAYFGEARVGRVSQDLDANAAIWAFLSQ